MSCAAFTHPAQPKQRRTPAAPRKARKAAASPQPRTSLGLRRLQVRQENIVLIGHIQVILPALVLPGLMHVLREARGTVSRAGTCAGTCGSAAGGRTSMCGRSWYPRNMIQNHIVVANTFPTRELMSAGRCNCGEQRTHQYCAVNKPVRVGGSPPAPCPRPSPRPRASGERRAQKERSSHQGCRTPAWRLRRTFSAAPAAPPPFSASTEASRTPTPARPSPSWRAFCPAERLWPADLISGAGCGAGKRTQHSGERRVLRHGAGPRGGLRAALGSQHASKAAG